MLLAIDIGNTQTVIGLFAGPDDDFEPDGNRADGAIDTDLVDHWRIATQSERTSDEHALVIQEFLGFHGFSFDDDIDGIAISSVVPRSTAAFREMTHKYFGFRPVVIEPGVKTGLPILTENPREVGADRIANAVAALDLTSGPAIVIDFGTATTFDALSSRGEYLGGVIAPGLEISLDALYTRAAALRRVELVEPRGVIGRTTVDSIQNGAVFGTAGMVDGICDRIAAELGTPTVIATGGLATLVAPHTRAIDRVEPWLTLHGLRLVFRRNAST
ncbi:MAG: type III pantothenate kinase [Actinobacteria bacterium]|nr:type III pantothenate kinase [Actinomycetota bacterium]